MEDVLDLRGRNVLITGAGQGVGRQAALLMASHGAGVVVVNDYFEERARDTVAAIEAMGGRAVAAQCDVSDFNAVRRMVTGLTNDLGPIEVLINNAGNAGPEAIGEVPKFWETGPEDWQRWLGTNLFGVMNCCHAVLPEMMRREYGRIVTTISDAGRVGDANYVVYSGAKGGAAGFMRGLARAVGRFNVTANCVSLAAMMTPGLEERLADPERRRKILSGYVIRRIGEPRDAASAILFLASDAASWVTGQTWAVNGGFSFGV